MSGVSEARLPDGGRIAFSVAGSGPAILLLRPLGGSLRSWGPFFELLSARLRVIAFDHRGTGDSGAACGAPTTSELARDARGLLDALSVERAHLYGISLGGMVACRLAIDEPARVDRVVLASTPVQGWRVGSRRLPVYLTLAPCLLSAPSRAQRCLTRRILSEEFRSARPEEVERLEREAAARPGTRGGLLRLVAASALHDVSREIGRIAAETLVLAGERDRFLPIEEQSRLARRLPNGSFQTLPFGHDLSAEAPGAVAERALGHLLEITRGRSGSSTPSRASASSVR